MIINVYLCNVYLYMYTCTHTVYVLLVYTYIYIYIQGGALTYKSFYILYM